MAINFNAPLEITKKDGKFAVCFMNDFGRLEVIRIIIGLYGDDQAIFNTRRAAEAYLTQAKEEVSRVIGLRKENPDFRNLVPYWPVR